MKSTNIMSTKALSLWRSSSSVKKNFMLRGKQPSNKSLIGSQYRGLNSGFWPEWFRFQKFIKTFYLEAHKLKLGNNFRVEQNGAKDEYIKLLKYDRPIEQGYFLVVSATADPKWSHYENALFLNYGYGGNKWYEPAKLLRDYVVQPFLDSPNILLGHAYFAVGPFQIPGPFFVLEKIT